MKEQLRYFIEKNNLINATDKVLVAVSGGIDSVVLLHLLKEMNYDVSLAHCNFLLRDEASDGDELFVRKLAAQLAIKFFVKQFDTNVYAKTNKISTQMAARDLRYAWFSELAQSENFSKIALAHHSDDQIETFFINLFRGSGITGMKGMLPINGQIIRPLLFANREMVMAYATANNILWREDHTNLETKYLRNKIRHQLLPLLENIHNGAVVSIVNSLAYLADENACYKMLLSEKMQHIVKQKDGYLSAEKNYFLDHEFGKQLLFEWIKIYGFNKTQLDSVFEGLKKESIGVVFYSPTHCLTLDRVEIQVYENKSTIELVLPQIEITTTVIDVPIKLQFTIREMDAEFKMDKNERTAQFDLETFSFPLRIRKWRPGDRFRPLGMRGTKLLSDYFTDKHFSAFQKRQTYLLVDKSDMILWVIGQRINDRNKITHKTKKMLTVVWSK